MVGYSGNACPFLISALLSSGLLDTGSLGGGSVGTVGSAGRGLSRRHVLEVSQKHPGRTGTPNTHLVEELVEDSRLSDLELSRLDGGVVDTQDHVDVLHRLCSDIGELLDLGGGILDLIVI